MKASHGSFDSRLRVGSRGNPAFAWIVVAVDEASCHVLDVVFGFALKTLDVLASYYHDEWCVALSHLQTPNGWR